MSGQNGLDEAARLEQALARIARAASRRPAAPDAADALHGATPRATSPHAGQGTEEIAARLDSLIAELRTLLGPHEFDGDSAVAQVTIRINGYAYTVGCDDGQEEHLMQMARSVEDRIDSIKAIGGQSGESRLLVLAALLMADELHDQTILLERLKTELSRGPEAEAESKRRLARLADRAEEIADNLEQ